MLVIRDVLRTIKRSSKAEHDQEGAVWKAAASAALACRSLKEAEPDMHNRLATLFSATKFLRGSGRFLIGMALGDSREGTNHVMPTTSESVYASLLKKHGDQAAAQDEAGFFMHATAKKVGVICLGPSISHSPIDRMVIISHEFTHAADFFFGFEPKLTTDVTDHTEAYRRTDLEFRAYRISALVIDGATDGAFTQFVEDKYQEFQALFEGGEQKSIALYPADLEYPKLAGIKTVGSTTASMCLERLLHEGLVSPNKAVTQMIGCGLVGQ